jgi:hypothetical protein
VIGHGEEIEVHDDHDHVQIRSAMRLKEVFWPTRSTLVVARDDIIAHAPQSSIDHLGQYVYCAFHGMRHPHRVCLHIPRRQTLLEAVSKTITSQDYEATHSLLEVDRGAGMSQRTRRPYLSDTLH